MSGNEEDPWTYDPDGAEPDDVEALDPRVDSHPRERKRPFNPAYDAYRPEQGVLDRVMPGEEYFVCVRCKVTQRDSLFPRTKSGNRSTVCQSCTDGKSTGPIQYPPLRKRRPQPNAMPVPGRPPGSPVLRWVRRPGLSSAIFLQADGPLGLVLRPMTPDAMQDARPVHLQIDTIEECWFILSTDIREDLAVVGLTRPIATGQTNDIPSLPGEGWWRYLLFERRSAD